MGINATNLKNLERKVREYNENLTLFEQQFVIIPFVASGYTDMSNYGQVNGQYLIDNFETYKRVWTGNDSFIITWKDSVEFVENKEQKKIEKNYKIGDALLGWLENNSSINEISTDTSFDYYKSQTSEQSLTFRINASKFNLNTNYEFMFYKVPEYSKDVLYRVESIDREYVGKDLLCYVLRLKALNQDLANTGQAKQQNVMPNSPGQGYYAPIVAQEYQPEENEKEGIDYLPFYNRYIVVDKQKMLNRPVKKVVVKAFGLCIFSNIAIWGRRAIYGDDFRSFGIPRWIFPINLTNASTQTLYRAQTSESNYYWIQDSKPNILFNSDIMTAMKNLFKTDALYPSQGFLDVNIEKAQATNPSTDETSYTYQLYGDNKLVDGAPKNQPWTIKPTTRKLRTDTIYGCEQFYLIKDEDTKIHDAMFDAFWVQKNMISLPITPKNTLSFGWTIGAAYAAAVAQNFISAATLLLIGITGTIINKVAKPDFQGFSGIIPASIFDFMASETNGIFGTIAKPFSNKIKLSYFETYASDNDINKFFNTQTINTSFEADLTDKIKSKRLVYTANETTCIGQDKWENGDNVCGDGKPFLLNGDATLVGLGDDEKDVGFIIDAFNLQAMFMGDFSIEFLDRDNNVVWSGIYQSQGKWTGSVREVNTWINTSIYGRENMFVSNPLPWPKQIPPLHLIGYEQPQPIEYKYGALENGKRLSLETYGLTKTFRQIIQDADKWGLNWKFNQGTQVHFNYIKKESAWVAINIEIDSFWGPDIDWWFGSYRKIDLDFDGFCMSKYSIFSTISFYTNNAIKKGDEYVLKQTVRFTNNGKIDEEISYRQSTQIEQPPSIGIPSTRTWTSRLSNPFGYSEFDVELRIFKEKDAIKAKIYINPSSNTALMSQVYEASSTTIRNPNGSTQVVSRRDWAPQEPNIWLSYSLQGGSYSQVNGHMGIFLRRIYITPYQVALPPEPKP